jgi:hypothetical protein
MCILILFLREKGGRLVRSVSEQGEVTKWPILGPLDNFSLSTAHIYTDQAVVSTLTPGSLLDQNLCVQDHSPTPLQP